jgi:type IV secretory pathway TraG/TraD family ATPase VirD4
MTSIIDSTRTSLPTARDVIIVLMGGSFAILANLLYFIMIGKVNERVPESERISYFWWGTEVRKKYKRLYPEGRLAIVADACTVCLVVFFVLGVWSWVFGGPLPSK